LLVPCILLFADLRLQVAGDRRRWTVLVVVSALFSGASSVMAKVANELPRQMALAGGTAGQLIFSYLAFAYATAAVVLFLSMERKRIQLRSFDAAFGIVMGMLGLVATWSLIRSLDYLPGIVVFPVKSAGGLVLTAVAAVLFWRERLTKRQTCGIAIGALSTVLING
ncbi:MAG: EamA family transporter, partial [Lentisphaeria bacterium]|nr:EamA family transporter [Lentisphaeria bacterium]